MCIYTFNSKKGEISRPMKKICSFKQFVNMFLNKNNCSN